jgi:hypothetical protein
MCLVCIDDQWMLEKKVFVIGFESLRGLCASRSHLVLIQPRSTSRRIISEGQTSSTTYQVPISLDIDSKPQF